MIQIYFDKARAEHFLDALWNDKPLLPGDKGWAAADLLTLMGVCFLYLTNHEIGSLPSTDPTGLQNPANRSEHDDAKLDVLNKAVHAALDVCTWLAFHVWGGTFDEKFLPKVTVNVVETDNGPDIQLVAGVRGSDPLPSDAGPIEGAPS
jgi:hypothetical protein